MPFEQDSPPNVILVLGSDHYTSSQQYRGGAPQRTPSPSTSPSPSSSQHQEKARWPCHKHILAKHSNYFQAMFACEFEEFGATIIFMPRGIFSSAKTLDRILHYMYHSTLDLLLDGDDNNNNNNQWDSTTTDTSCSSTENDEPSAATAAALLTDQLTQYQDLYGAADYLGMGELCGQLADKLFELAHHCNCYCSTCVYIVPSLFAFTQPRAANQDDLWMMKLADAALAVMTHDPEKALVAFWTCPSMIDVLWSLYCSPHLDYSPPSIDNPLTQSLLNHISKTSAIESLHGCYIGTRLLMDGLDDEHDVILHATFRAARHKATATIATHFDFYCSKYPTLLSCIDGIVYSSSFLEYLLMRTIHDQINPRNAGILYQGVVRHLLARHAVQHSSHLTKIFNAIKEEIIHYIFYHAKDIRACDGLVSLDDNLLTCLAQDVALPLDRLVKTAASHHHHHHLVSSSQQHQQQSLHLPSDQHHSTSWTKFLSIKRKRPNSNKRHALAAAYNIPKLDEIDDEKRHIATTNEEEDLQHHPRSPFQSWSLKTWMLRWNKTYQMEIHTVAVGRRVELIQRPVLTTGTVAFVGHVTFADGIWVGVELDRRVGKSDGSVDGQRYFTTSPSRGEFVRINQVGVLLS
ncbi:unnamed protein product [Absidia cylindrospora]